MIEVNNLCKSFKKQNILDGITLSIHDKDKIILLGQNGAGKTTLIRCILGEYFPDKGSVSVYGHMPYIKREDALHHISFVPQIPPPLNMTVNELLLYSSGLSGFCKEKVIEYCDMLDFDIKPHLTKTFYKFSGGMKQKLLIAIAFARNTDFYIFDEPTANLDTAGREKFYIMVEKLISDKSFIMISHRIDEVKNIVNRNIELDLGRIIRDEKV